jgi:hypothetical protein
MTQLAVMCVPSVVPMASSTYVHLFASLRPISSGSLPPLLFFPIPPIKAAPLPLLPALLVSLLALNGATRNMGVGRARLPSPAGRSPLPLWALHCVREKNSQYAHGHQVCINVTYRRINSRPLITIFVKGALILRRVGKIKYWRIEYPMLNSEGGVVNNKQTKTSC